MEIIGSTHTKQHIERYDCAVLIKVFGNLTIAV